MYKIVCDFDSYKIRPIYTKNLDKGIEKMKEKVNKLYSISRNSIAIIRVYEPEKYYNNEGIEKVSYTKLIKEIKFVIK